MVATSDNVIWQVRSYALFVVEKSWFYFKEMMSFHCRPSQIWALSLGETVTMRAQVRFSIDFRLIFG